ncbi:hypothetical protein N9V64_03885 [Candidatus Pelagibacter bacterium]|jgi:hypothetical protein|nr:hypothetical protein [Candidatus Pelagibacter bacterium]
MKNFNQIESGINYVEVGHGVGIGASLKNSQGQSFCTDEEYIEAANLVKIKNKKNNE